MRPMSIIKRHPSLDGRADAKAKRQHKKIPDIYHSPQMRCVFTIGTEEDHNDDVFRRASLKAEAEESVWCGENSGLDPWSPAQRLARSPVQIYRHYCAHKFKRFENVKPRGRCMESQIGASVCPACDAFQSNPKRYPMCAAPRTFVPGANIRFLYPHERKDNQPGGNSTSSKITPEGSSETKRV